MTAVIFRAGTLQAAWGIYQGLATTIPDFSDLGNVRPFIIGAVCAILLPSSRDLSLLLTREPRPLIAAMLGLAGIVILVQLGSEDQYEFVYFQF